MALKVFLFSGECGPSTEPEKPGVAALRVQGQGFKTCFVNTYCFLNVFVCYRSLGPEDLP